jgi:trimethylamine---corrinoid protein Co-methyltransferase
MKEESPMRPRVRFLSDDVIGKVVDEAYKLLETQGVRLNHSGLLQRFGDLGCPIDREKSRVRFPRGLAERCVASVPRQVKLWNLAGTSFCDLSGDKVHFTPGSTAIKVLDHQTKRMRAATLQDVVTYGKLVEQIPAIDYSSTAITSSDVPKQIGDSIRLYALLKTTTKPICTGAFSIEGFDVMRDLQLAVRGTREELKAKPFALFSCCPTSPFKWSRTTSDNTMKCAELGIPVEFIAMPLSGLVGPISLIGCVIQHTAETLSGIIISQTSCAGAPILYGGSPGIFDMRSMAATISSVEAQMIDCAYTEVGKHLGLPTQAYIGMSDSKLVDAQAGFESGTGYYLAALAGINSVSGPGMHYFESCQSLEKTVIDAEMCGFARRLVAGLAIRDEFPSDAIFEELLQEENLLTSPRTLKYFREEHHLPGPVIDRTQVSTDAPTAPDACERAHTEVIRRLGQYRPPEILTREQIKEMEKVMRSAAGEYPITI